MISSEALPSAIIRPCRTTLMQEHNQRFQSDVYIISVLSTTCATMLAMIPCAMFIDDSKIKAISLMIGTAYLSGIISGLIFMSLSEVLPRSSTKPIGYIVNFETTQELPFIDKLRRSPLSTSTLECIGNLLQLFINSKKTVHINDSQLGNQANIIEKNYALNDLNDGEAIGRWIGRANGFIQCGLAVTNIYGRPSGFSFLGLFLGIVIGEYLTEPVFSKTFNLYSNCLGAGFTGRFFNVTANEIKRVYYPEINPSNASSIQNPLLTNHDIEQNLPQANSTVLYR